MSQTANPQEFSRLRSFFWPVHMTELKKVLPMILIFFLICFNYNILRSAKDALVVTAKNSDAGVLPFIKIWALLPMALIMTVIFTRLGNRYKKETIFYWMVSIFIGFFVLFTTVLYPLRDVLHPTEFADSVAAFLPKGLMGFVAMFRNWTYTLFYVMCELWGSIMLQLLFWGFANDVITVKEAKRFYGLFGVGANFSGIFAGQASIMISAIASKKLLFTNMESWTQSIVMVNIAVVIVGFAIMAIFRWLNTQVIAKEPAADVVSKFKKPKVKMSMRENFATLKRSKYLMFIAIIVLAYNLVIHLTEVVWKNQVNQVYQDPVLYNSYMGKVSIITNIVATLIALFITSNVIRKAGWTKSAMITPAVLLITTIGFFSFLVFRNSLGMFVAPFLGMTPFTLALFFGTSQNCMSRASKYTLYDATKEMTFIPLTPEEKMKGKAAIDGVGSRLGKSGGALIYHVLLLLVPLAGVAPYVGVLLLIAIGAWMLSVKALGKRFETQTALGESMEKAKDLKEAAELKEVLKEEEEAKEEELATIR
ncbi:MAG: ADP,ATP carrier protein 1 [Chlamydiae bacterium]|nr:ADP,ATP carrier protein 1 [Chlamydiota bacterium]